MKRAAVFCGGGVAGISWMLGLAQGLRDAGIDLAVADQVSGTSAGACVAANVATGALDEAAARQRREAAEIVVPFDINEFLGLVERANEEEPDEASALIRIAAMDPIGPSISQEQRLGVIAARLPVAEWPASPRLVVNAVDAGSGKLRGLDRESGFTLLEAVAASCALPGIWPPLELTAGRFVDGGIRSLSNADAAAGHDVVAIVAPTALSDSVRAHHEREIAALGDARVVVIAADAAALEAIGPNPLDPERREPALEAGLAQAADELDALAALWGG